jgi:predicted ATPase
VGDTPQLFPVLWGLWAFSLIRAEVQTARELANHLLGLAHHKQDTALSLQAYYVSGETLFYLGEFVPARAHLEQSLRLYDPQHHRSQASLYGGIDPGVFCLSRTTLALWFLGYADQALQKSHQALTLAREGSHPYGLGIALFFAAEFHQCRREGRRTREQAEATIALSIEQGFPEWLAIGTILRGWALAEQGQVGEGIAQLHQGLAALQTIGTEVERPYYLALLAEAYGKAGQVVEGLSVLAEALATVNKTGERWYGAELYRLKGQLTLQSQQVTDKSKASLGQVGGKSDTASTQHLAPSTPVQVEAEACFHKAIEIARGQQAKSLELRATMSLSRLWQRQGKTEEARQMLAEIYDWFIEGFDTTDLKEAKALLDHLTQESVKS